jgi:hypothetical protein
MATGPADGSPFERRLAGVRIGVWLLIAWGLASLALVAFFQQGTGPGGDWYRVWEPLAARLRDHTLYAQDSLWRYSPVAAWILAVAVVPLGLVVWAVLHVVALVPVARVDRRIAAIALFGWPFMVDVIVGNVFTFVFVPAFLAVRGSRWATYLTYALFVLMPRPVMVPIIVWLLWKRRDTWLGFVAIFAIHAGLVVLSGYGMEWLARLAGSAAEVDAGYNIGPSRWIGQAWLIAGIPLGIVLFLRGYVGLAGVVGSPYLLPQYLLLGLVWPHHPAKEPSSEPMGGL